MKVNNQECKNCNHKPYNHEFKKDIEGIFYLEACLIKNCTCKKFDIKE